VTKDEDYIEVDAVIRMPRGERLADSKKTEGWSRGYTPKSTEKGPEHVEIRLKQEDEEGASDPRPAEPRVSSSFEPPREKTHEQQLEELRALLVLLAVVKTAEWAQPHLQRLWNEHVIPFFSGKRDQWQKRKTQRGAGKQSTTQPPTTVTEVPPVEETNGVSDALETYEANMTSAEAGQHFAEAIVAQHFANEKMRLLANSRLRDSDVPRDLVNAIESLTPKQVETTLDSILTSKPTLVTDLGKVLQVSRNEDQLQLGSAKMKAALRLTEKVRQQDATGSAG
jgi:hypothetical protein